MENNDKKELEERIEKLRKKLYKLRNDDNCDDAKVLKMSEKLDQLIVKYYKDC